VVLAASIGFSVLYFAAIYAPAISPTSLLIFQDTTSLGDMAFSKHGTALNFVYFLIPILFLAISDYVWRGLSVDEPKFEKWSKVLVVLTILMSIIASNDIGSFFYIRLHSDSVVRLGFFANMFKDVIAIGIFYYVAIAAKDARRARGALSDQLA